MIKTSKTSGKHTLFFGSLWAITYIICLLIVKELHPQKTMGVILSFLPVITFILFISNFITGIGEMDEVQRRVQLEAAVWAFTLSLLLLMTLGLLDFVVVLKKEDWSYRHLVPHLFVFYFIGILISNRKYR